MMTAEDIDKEINNPFVTGLVLAAIDDNPRFKIEQGSGHSFILRTKFTGSRYRVTVERIPDAEPDAEPEQVDAVAWEGDPHRHPGQFAGRMCHDHDGFGYHCHDLNPPPSWGVEPGQMYADFKDGPQDTDLTL